MKYVITHVNIFDGYENHDLLLDQNIYIEDDIITRISKELIPGYKIIDKAGYYCIPGLINLHAHLFGSGKPSKVLGGGNLQQTIIKLARTSFGQKILNKVLATNMKQALYSGCTTIRGVGDFFYSDVKLRNQINNKQIIGPRLIVSGPAITVPGGHGDGTFAITGSSLNELVDLTKLNINNHVDLIKICVTGGVMDAKVKGEPGEVKMNYEQTKVICDEAHKHGYKVASHTESPEGVKIAIEAGVDTIEHGSLLNDELAHLALKQNTAFICTLSPALPLATLPSELTKLNDLCTYNSKVVLDNMIEGIKKALEYHITVGLGTDASCPFVTQYNMWREVVYFQKYLNVSNAKALSTATLENAKIINMDHLIGTIEAGKIADMIILKNDPLKDLTVLKNIDTVISQGNIYNDIKIKKNEMIEKELDTLIK